MRVSSPASPAGPRTSRAEGALAFLGHRFGIIVFVTLLALGGAAAYVYNARPLYTSTASLYVQPAGSRVAGDKSTVSLPISFLNTQREIIGSAGVLANAVSKLDPTTLKTFADVADPVAWLHKELAVKVSSNDELIRVQVDSPYPQDAADIVTAVISSYIEFQSGEKKSAAARQLETLKKKRGDDEQRIADVDRTMREIQTRARTLSFDRTKETITRELGRLDQDVRDSEKRLVKAKLMYDKAVLAWGPDPLPPETIAPPATIPATAPALAPSTAPANMLAGLFPTTRELATERATTQPTTGASYPADTARTLVVFASDNDLDAMPDEIKEAERQYDVLQEQYLPRHPRVKEGLQKIITLKTRFLTATRLRVREVESQLARAKAALSEEEKLARDFADQSAQFARLEKDKAELTEHASVLGNRIQKADTDEDAGALDILVSDPATPSPFPSKPNRTMVMLSALGAGLLGGTVLAFLRHQTDPNFRSTAELESAVQLPVLGTLPGTSRTAGVLNPANVVPPDKWSQNAELCRQIASSLTAVWPRGSSPALLVTSPRSGEGRSTVARDLAIALATAGERVLLIDADFQNPSLHALVGTRNTEGLSTVVAGEMTIDAAAVPSSIAGLEILTTGPAPALPAAMFDSVEFEAFLATMAEHFSRVILDAAPVRGSNDARIAASLCGATLLVLPSRGLSKRVIRETRERLIGFGARIVGVVLNELPRRRVTSKRAAPSKRVKNLQTLSRMVAEGHEKTAGARAKSGVGSR